MAKRGRPRKMENLFNAPSKQNTFTEGNKSAGILDDFAVRKVMDTQEGTITKVPVNNYDIVNKAYVDAAVAPIVSDTNFWLSGGGILQPVTDSHQLSASNLIIDGTISAGNIATTGDIQATTANLAGLDISNDGTKTTILGTSGDYNRIGDAGTTNHGLASNDDLMVTGKFEVDGNADFDGFANFRSRAVFGDAVASYYGSNSDMKLEYSTAQNPDTMVYWLDSTAKSLIFSLNSLAGRNLDHGAQADPTLIIHSSTDPNSDNTQWLSLTHDQTDGVIGVGTGALKMPATLKVGSTTLTEQNIIDLLALLE